MSRIPDDIESKYNNDNKFKWVDSQLEKFMERQKSDAERIQHLEDENIKIRIMLYNLRDEYLEMGGDPNELELFSKVNIQEIK